MRRAPHMPGKVAAAPEMGAAMYSPVSSATGDSGRSHGRTNDDPANNAASAFEEQQKQLLNHPHNEAHPFPVGANQSARLKSAAEDWTEKLLASSPVPVRHGESPAFVTHGDDKYITHNRADKNQWPGLAHELGHADVDKSTLGALSQSGAADLLMKAAPIVGGAQGLAGVRWPVTLATAGLMSAPRVGSELAADYKGYQRLKELGADDKTLREYLGGIAGQQASYLMPATLAVGANRAMNFAMKHAKHKLARRMTFRGLDISIETDTGDKREWYDPHADKHGTTVMKYPYGYIRKTLGTDGDHVDVYVGPDEEAAYVYVVNQMKAPEFKVFDEQKCMLGFGNAAAAKKAYLDHYTDTRFFGSMKRIGFEDFKAKVLNKENHGEKVAGHADTRFSERSTLDKSHLANLRTVLRAADLNKLPVQFTVPLVDGTRAVVARVGDAKPKLTLKTVLAAHMKSKDPVITIDTLHASKQAALSDQRVMDLAGFKQTPNKDLPDAQVARGTAIEKEHTDRPGIAKQIAVDHLNERPDYYKLLERYVESAPPGAGDALGTKHASLAHLIFGPLGHVATNVFGRAAHHASNLAEVLAHRGLQHGLTETVTNPAASRTIKSLAGAEALVPYEAGLQLGAKLRDLAPAERAAHIQMLHTAPHTNAPVLSALRKAVGHEVAGTAPELAAKGMLANTYARGVDTLSNIANGPFDTGVQRVTKTVAGGAPLAGLFALDPVGGAAHVGINAIREGIGNSTAGRKFIKDTFAHGLSGKHVPAPIETAIDYAVSPAVLDSYRAGRTLRGELPETLHPHLTNENLEQVLQHKHLLSRPQPAAAPGAPVPTQLFATPPTTSHTPGTPAGPAPHNLRVASDFSAFSSSNTANQGPGPTHNQVPGDFLGLPLSQPRGYRRIVGGHPETPDEGIARTFRFHDEPTDTYTMDGNTAAQPSGPAI